jgi:hypothetical protein
MALTNETPPVGSGDEVEVWIPVRGFGVEAGAWTPPPVYPDPTAETSALRQIEDQLYRLSGGNVVRARPTGPVFGPPLAVRYLDLGTMVPALRRRDRLAITLMSVGWMICFTLFWIWWLSPQNRIG